VIGDIHGQAETLARLLRAIGRRDRDAMFWFVGDLINRGPDDRGVLDQVRTLGDRATVVLGNHELALLACAAGAATPRRGDTVGTLLEAPDADALVAWVRRWPLLVRDGDDVLVHAGLHPSWTDADADRIAARLHDRLGAPDWDAWLRALWPHRGEPWPEQQVGPSRDGADLHALVSVRCVRPDGALDRSVKGPPDTAPAPLLPWHRVPSPRSDHTRVFTGHWAAQGLVRSRPLVAIDTGCAWGGHLTAVCREDGAMIQVSVVNGEIRERCDGSTSAVPSAQLP
jgi:bis(5'-nucleosyl)-tetraphosphatase (symmetrical)